MRPVHAPRWAALRRALLRNDDGVGVAGLVTAAFGFGYMGGRMLFAWHAGLL